MQRNPYWPLNGPSFFLTTEIPSVYFTHCPSCTVGFGLKFRGADGKSMQLREYARPDLVVRLGNRSCGIHSTSLRPPRIRMFTEPLLR